MTETWKCTVQRCDGEHPVEFQFCPVSGQPRSEAETIPADYPITYRESPGDWDSLQNAVGALDSSALQMLGLVRIDNVPDMTLPVLSPEFRELALEQRQLNGIAVTISALPLSEDGSLDWELAGPWMNRELPLARFVAQYCVGDVEDLERTLRMILNEWHGLERDTGLPEEGA